MGLKVGLLGGSFNPAHEGHLYISQMALKTLGLDEVWWLVSPQNPLKSKEGMLPYGMRFRYARFMAHKNRRIIVRDIERHLGTRRTVQTVRKLKRRYTNISFVWLMGADNLEIMDKWWHWRRLFYEVPIAIFARPSYDKGAVESFVARHFRHQQISVSNAIRGGLVIHKLPAWVFLEMTHHGQSATTIRKYWVQEEDRPLRLRSGNV